MGSGLRLVYKGKRRLSNGPELDVDGGNTSEVSEEHACLLRILGGPSPRPSHSGAKKPVPVLVADSRSGYSRA